MSMAAEILGLITSFTTLEKRLISRSSYRSRDEKWADEKYCLSALANAVDGVTIIPIGNMRVSAMAALFANFQEYVSKR
ncbi:hypothetical protein RRF57_002823 [Xylaria bambusicola]|uniref:Uncharacterized protein n=1 Tax=Xylaria bambusicola TaxID=326684 RepID=A0AAN7UF68_9PEZI